MQGSINFDGSLVGNITGGGGGGGDKIIITPVVTSGTKIADVSVNGVEKDLYCPTPPTPPEVDITPVVTSGTKIADVSIGGVEKDLYTPDYGADITEIKQSLSDFETLEKTASGAIATFDDGSDLPMPKLEVAIEPGQSGSGDPSPTNVRPISGWSEANVSVCGKNLFDKTHYKFVKSGYINSGGAWEGSTTILSYPTDSLSGYWNSPMIDIEPFRGMTLSYSRFVSAAGTARGIVDKDFNVLATLGNSAVASNTVDLSQYPTAKYLVLTFIASDYNFDNAQLEIGTTATTYTPYNGQTYTIDLDGTRYGGTLDVVSGLLTITDVYIASYNSEILPSTWISDRDVYAEGTTPTVGAEVVYKLATPQTVQLTPTQVNSLLGVNNIWANTGDLELTYLTNNPLTQTVYDMVKILVEQST